MKEELLKLLATTQVSIYRDLNYKSNKQLNSIIRLDCKRNTYLTLDKALQNMMDTNDRYNLNYKDTLDAIEQKAREYELLKYNLTVSLDYNELLNLKLKER